MKIFNRVKDVVKVDVQGMIDEKKRKKNSPAVKLNQFMRQCEDEIKSIEVLVNRQSELKSKLYQEKKYACQMVTKRETQFEIVEKAGGAELEKRAQEELTYYKEQVAKLEGLYKKAEKDEDDLQNQLQLIRHQLKEMYTRRLELMTREAATHASKRMASSVAILSASETYFTALEKEIEQFDNGIQMEYERTPFDVKVENLERALALKEKENKEA